MPRASRRASERSCSACGRCSSLARDAVARVDSRVRAARRPPRPAPRGGGARACRCSSPLRLRSLFSRNRSVAARGRRRRGRPRTGALLVRPRPRARTTSFSLSTGTLSASASSLSAPPCLRSPDGGVVRSAAAVSPATSAAPRGARARAAVHAHVGVRGGCRLGWCPRPQRWGCVPAPRALALIGNCRCWALDSRLRAGRTDPRAPARPQHARSPRGSLRGTATTPGDGAPRYRYDSRWWCRARPRRRSTPHIRYRRHGDRHRALQRSHDARTAPVARSSALVRRGAGTVVPAWPS